MFFCGMTESKIWASLHPFYEEGSRLGRIEANCCFIRALLERDPFEAYHFFLPLPRDCEALAQALRGNFPALWQAGRFVLRLHRDLPEVLSATDYYCMHLSDPFNRYTDAMCMRNAFSRRIFPLTAPTHSLSYAEYGREFLQHIWGGATSRDCVAATSSAGVRVVEAYYKELRGNYGLDAAWRSPCVRQAPLGVEPRDLPAPEERPSLGAACRSRFGLGDGLLFLIFARISYQSKMDVLPVLRAFKRAEALGLAPGSYTLALSGWLDEGDSFGDDIKKLAANLGINCLVVPRPDNETRKSLYAAADVFISASDNLQETFGLTMLEAAVSSLPIIASDFDGYKDLVLHGQTGLLVPTTGPDFTPGTDMLRSIVPASEYHLLLAQQCAVDVPELGTAIWRLAADSVLRRSMGAAGRDRVLGAYTWRHIVQKYMDLWAALNDAPCALPENPWERPASALFHPSSPHYMDVFGGYFTRPLSVLAASGRKLRWSRVGEAVYRGQDYPVIYRLVEGRVSLDALKKLLFAARKGAFTADLRAVLTSLPAPRSGSDPDFLILWALKHDLLELEP